MFGFLRNQSGNVAMITALTMVPVLGLLAGSVDIVRATTFKRTLSHSIDSAALAAANLTNTGDIETVVDEYINSNLSMHPEFKETINVDVQDEVALNSKTITITATGKVDTYFLGLFNINTLPIEVSATATQSITNVEIALVLDISSSMRGQRITKLKAAASDFVDEMLNGTSKDTTSISVIPFGGTVNVGPILFTKFAALPTLSTLNPTEKDYDKGKKVFDKAFRFIDGDFCLEHPSEDFDNDNVLPLLSRGQVPHFWRWNNFNPWCPLANSGIFMNSNDADDLTNHINGMTLSDGTGMDIGAMWGLKALSPKWKGEFGGDFIDRPAPYDEKTLKVFIVMTDGGITAQDRPEDYAYYSTHTNRSTSTAADGNGYGNQGNNKNKQVIVDRGNANTKSNKDQAVGYFKRVCDEAQSQGAVVYTIGFQIKSGSLPDSMLKYCASDASKYYHIESLDIGSAFDAIATSVNALRLTG